MNDHDVSNPPADRETRVEKAAQDLSGNTTMTSPFGNAVPALALGIGHDAHGNRGLVLALEHRVHLAEDVAVPPPYDTERLYDALRGAADELRGRDSVPLESITFDVPIPLPGKIVALGRTYPAHAVELGNEPAAEPLVFGKLTENLVPTGVPVALSWSSGTEEAGAAREYDNEIELAVLIGRPLSGATVEQAGEAIAGYTMVNDITLRSEQRRAREAGQPWFLAKNPPGAFPIGPWFVPRAAVPEPRSLEVRCRVDGEIVQNTDTSGLMASPAELLSWLSHRAPLNVGDLVALGTPPGVSAIRPGSVVIGEIEGLGRLESRFIERNT